MNTDDGCHSAQDKCDEQFWNKLLLTFLSSTKQRGENCPTQRTSSLISKLIIMASTLRAKFYLEILLLAAESNAENSFDFITSSPTRSLVDYCTHVAVLEQSQRTASLNAAVSVTVLLYKVN